MLFALFGINNDSLNLAINLLVLTLVVVWIALIYWTYTDAKRRLTDPVLVTTATAAAFFPFIGTVVYTILRPPEFLEDARERELETRAAELRLRQLAEKSCPRCEHPVEFSWLRCPECQHRLKDPCSSCGRPVDPRWAVCPHCETAVARREPSKGPERAEKRRPEAAATKPRAESRSAAQRRSEERAAAAKTAQAPARSARTSASQGGTRSAQGSTRSPQSEGSSGSQRPKQSADGDAAATQRSRRRPRPTT